jgi:UMF1 family MFS transporter
MDPVVEEARPSSPISDVKEIRKQVWSWAFYDWANSSFATTVMAGFFPLFFKKYWSLGLDASHSTFYLGLANSASSLALGLLAPILGSVADQGGLKKWMLGFFTGLGVIATSGLFFVGPGDYFTAATLYAVAAVGFVGSNIFYDALLVHVSSPSRLHFNSGLGYSLGYLGGGLLFAINVMMFQMPQAFGLSDGPSAVKAAFLTVGIWWTLFSLPLFFWVPEPGTERALEKALTRGWKVFLETLRHVSRYRSLSLFLLAYLFYIDGVNTTIKMAVDYGLSLGFQDKDLIGALLMVQFIGFPAAIFTGYLGEKIGARKGIFICLTVYSLVVIGACFMSTSLHFFVMAAAIGLVQGGIQSLSRSLFGELVPLDRSAEFFGFFNMVGKFSAIFGPLLVGITSELTGRPRLSILVLLAFFLVGGVVLYLTPQIQRTER